MRTTSDEELMERFCDGEPDALAELYRRHRPALLAAMRRTTSSSDDAQDVVQEAFLRVQRARDTYRRGQAVRPWLWTIAHNVRKDLLRGAARRPEACAELEAMAAAEDPMRPIERAQSAALLRRALVRLSPVLRDTAVSHWLEERDFDEIAKCSRKQPATIRVRAHRACARLRELLWIDLRAA